MRLIAILAASLLLTGTAHAATARAQLDAFTTGLDALDGTFVQQVYDADGRLGETSKGTVALQAPRQFRWEYAEPFPQVIVADGRNVWIWDKDLDQVTVRAQSLEESQSPLTVLTDLNQLDRDYRTTEAGERDGATWLVLVPLAKEASITQAELGFVDGQLARMTLTDNLGAKNELTFGRWQRNPKLAATMFTFTVPEGVDVVGEPVEGADAFPVKE
jgi:outer membrane lipoprotein carrier protein